jgi:hypothetical protein
MPLSFLPESVRKNSLTGKFWAEIFTQSHNLWGLEPSRNRVVVPARKAIQSDGIGSLESILGLLKSFKIRALDAAPHFQGSWVAGILGLGAILGGLSASYVGNKYGR